MMELPKHLNPKISKLKGKLLAAHKKKHTHTPSWKTSTTKTNTGFWNVGHRKSIAD